MSMLADDTVDRAAAISNPGGEVRLLTRDKLEAFVGLIRDDGTYKDRIYESANSASRHIATDYGRRFLIELVQNAYDAHPPVGRAGRIKVVLRGDEGPFGTLYVANEGQAFGGDNVKALCDLGLSSKPPGETVGNKGLGFRSVHHVSDDPQIFSALSASARTFDGYRFRFASHDDLDRLLATPQHRELAKRDLPLFHTPVWIDEVPEAAQRFARDGFVTAVRLPLRNEPAREAVAAAFDEVRQLAVPLNLFLPRVALIEFAIEAAAGAGAFGLSRAAKDVFAAKDERYEIVDLAEQGRYFVAHRSIAEERVRAAIDASIEAQELHDSWRAWHGCGEVAVAARLDDAAVEPRLYTFLPMGGQAAAPFHGHLHGTFFPKSDRTSLKASIPLNGLLLREAASLAARAALWLAGSAGADGAATVEAAARAAVDLMTWHKGAGSLEGLRDGELPALVRDALVASAGGQSILDAPIVPCWGETPSLPDAPAPALEHRPARRAREWTADLKAFPEAAAAIRAPSVGLSILWSGLGAERIGRLQRFLSAPPLRALQLEQSERAALAEAFAVDLHREGQDDPEAWTGYYRDLPAFLGPAGAPSLFGRRVLLCSGGRLNKVEGDGSSAGTQGEPRRRSRKDLGLAVFSPSDRLMGQRAPEHADDDDPLRPPESLAGSFAFLDDRLDWYGETLTKTRQYFEAARLVRPYQGDEVLAHVSDAIKRDARKSTRRDALMWAFRLWRRSMASNRPISLREAKLYVPTRTDDYIEAGEVCFGVGWPDDTQGPLLEDFLQAAASHADDLRAMRGTLLALPDARPFSRKMLMPWRDFLRQIGVRCGLQPVARHFGSDTVEAWKLSTFDFCRRLGIADSVAAAWRSHVAAAVGALPYGRGAYRITGGIWVMPGQEALAGDGLAPEAREMFATLVAHWFREHADPDEHFTVTAVNPNRSTSSRQVWPTPLAAFLRDSPWFPVDWPAGGADGRRHLPCRQAWLAADNQSERPPAVLPQIAISFRRALARLSPERLDLLVRMCGLRVLNRVEDLWAQADFLASFYATGAVARHDARAFARLYEQTWALLADAASGPAEPPLRHFLVRQGGELRAVDLAAERSGTDRQPVYVRDGADELPADLLAAAGRAVFDVGAAKASRVAALVQSLADDVFVPASSALIAAFADGVEIKAALAGGALPPCCAPIVARCPSLPVLVLLAMEALNGAAARRLPADRREVVDRLADVVVWPANALTFRVGGEPVDVPAGATAAVLVAAPGRQVVVGSGVRDSILAWADLTRMLPKVSEAVAQPDVAVHLRALFGELEKRNLPVDGTVADDVLAALAGVLWLKPDAALAALDLLNARAERWLPWLEAVVHCCAGEAARAAFAASAPGLALDAAALKAAVERHVADSGIAADRLIDACRRSRAPGQLRDDLGLDFAAFNRSLRAAGLAPETHPALHKAAWATFIDTHWADILLPLRGHCAAKLDQRRPAPEYPELLSELRRLEPDEDWLERHQAPPEPLCRARVEAWLKARSLPAIGKSPVALPPYLETRKGNTEAVRRFAGKAGERVRAWCAGQRTSAPPLWQDPGSSPQALFAALEAVGVIDFRPLEEATLVGWAVALALWPDGMPPALDLAALGLKTEALEKQRQSDKDSRDQRNKELRSFVFNGRSVDPREADREALSAEIAMGMPRSLRSAGLANPLKLAPLPPTARSGGGTSRGTGGGAGRTNREKTEIVGYMGEAAVYHWLKAKFANQDIDAAWVSSNREALLLEPGNDGLGYDFEVRFRRQTWRLEVKASLGDPCQFEMGETEVRAARDALLSRTAERYCIVYVSNLATPSELRIEVLPNPLSEEAAGLLRVRGEGLRYQFKRA